MIRGVVLPGLPLFARRTPRPLKKTLHSVGNGLLSFGNILLRLDALLPKFRGLFLRNPTDGFMLATVSRKEMNYLGIGFELDGANGSR